MKDVVSLIRAKRDGKKLAPDEIGYLINGIADQTIPDYQAAAFLMATYLKGMDQEEAQALTEAMMHSGDILDLSGIDGFTCDKHSTGGVGDKITMIIAPMAAALGIKVPMYSGRGLGHTGGTIDKLDSVPGFQSTLDNERFMKNLQTVGIAARNDDQGGFFRNMGILMRNGPNDLLEEQLAPWIVALETADEHDGFRPLAQNRTIDRTPLCGKTELHGRVFIPCPFTFPKSRGSRSFMFAFIKHGVSLFWAGRWMGDVAAGGQQAGQVDQTETSYGS